MLRLNRIAYSLALICVVTTAALADTLRLKDGSRIKGRVVTFADGRFIVAVGEGSRTRQLTVRMEDVESIEFDTNRPVPATTAANTPPVRPVSDPRHAASSPPRTQPSNPAPQRATSPATSAPPRSGSAKPVEIAVRVLGDNTANGWTNSGWVVKAGQRIRVSGTGEVSLGRGRTTGPSGLYDVEDGEKLLRSVPTGALIAVIGDDNNEFIYIGSEREFTAARDGILFLGVNEGNLSDNSGAFNVKVEITPDDGE